MATASSPSAPPFQWQIPERFNIAVACCDRWTDPARTALIFEDEQGRASRLSFAQLAAASNQLAHVLVDLGLARGDRVAVLLAQSPETALTHLATYKCGAIAVPLFALFGPDALLYRLADSAARVLVTDRVGFAKIAPLLDQLPALRCVLLRDPPGGDDPPVVQSLQRLMRGRPTAFKAVDTAADDPALIIYTSGTTGKPKGVLHAHRVLLGHLPGVEMSHGRFPLPGDLIWTPADWAWIGGLLDVLLPAWYHGVPVLARRFTKFDAEAAFELMARHQVTCTFLPPTALRMLRLIERPRSRWSLALRSVASGGEPLGEALLDWGRQALGLTLHEFYGQTECNMIVSACAPEFETPPGAIGRAVHGHEVRIIDAEGGELPRGLVGQIAARSPDPVMFLRYWNKPEATREKFIGDWLVTGDTGTMDEAGNIRFVGRDDDVITSAGYRIGPGPIEDCLLSHPAVREAAVIGAPDDQRTEIVKAFVVLREGFSPDAALSAELQEHVRSRLAAHEYPREIAYLDALPVTTTGKIIRRELRTLTPPASFAGSAR